MTKQRLHDENFKLLTLVTDLRRRQAKAIDALEKLSRGLGRDFTGRSGGWDECMKKLAAEELAEIAKMSLREV